MNIPTDRVEVRIRFAIGMVAVAAASLGLLSFGFGDFAPSAANLPHWIPGQGTWVRLGAAVLLAASVGLFFPRVALLCAYAIGAYELIWVAIGTPPIIASPFSIGAWYGFVEALTALVGTFILWATLHWDKRGLPMPNSGERAVHAAQVIFGIACVFYGCSHFAFADYTATMVPHWLPGRLPWAYVTGGAHVAAGLAIAIGVLPRLAATLEAVMMTLFGVLVWVPTFFVQPPPAWAMPSKNQWSELVVNVVLAAAAWVVAMSFAKRVPRNKE